MNLTESYKRVHYALRPAKQVERRILVDALLLLSEAGFPVRDYQYTGMGSIHFVDFTLFHKLLGIESMLSVEMSKKIDNRVRFNVPYKDLIQLEIGKPIGNFISSLDHKRQHLLWLDYDDVLQESMLQDVAASGSTLPVGSLLLVTVDTEPPHNLPDRKKNTPENLRANREYFKAFADYYLQPYKEEDFEYDKLPVINTRAVSNALKTGLNGRSGVFFQPLFNFLYADGHRMLTLGGMICDKACKKQLLKSRLSKMAHVRMSLTDGSFWIRVPILTRKEQIHLDACMPGNSLDFELSTEDVENYRSIYRFYPSYAEVLM